MAKSPSDRHISRSGLDNSLRKSGGGAHNWGSTLDEMEGDYVDEIQDDVAPKNTVTLGDALPERTKDRRESVSTSSSQNDEDKEKAVAFRAKALKDGTRESSFTLSHSLKMSSVYPCPPYHVSFTSIPLLTYASLVAVDLGSIARTSVAVSSSPK